MRKSIVPLVAFSALITLSLNAGDQKKKADGAGEPKLTKKEAIDADMKKLQGLWNTMKAEVGGRIVVPKGQAMLIDGNTSYNVMNGKKHPFDFKITIDPTTTPKQIDFSGRGGTSLGIYRFTEDGLEVCYCQENGTGSGIRPVEFSTKKNPRANNVFKALERDVDESKANPKKEIVEAGGNKLTKKEAIKADLKKLQGNWDVAKSEVRGSPQTARGSGILFDGDSYYTVVNGVKKNFAGGMPAKVYLDPTTNPKQIDLVWMGGSFAGVYRFTEDGLEICMTEVRAAGGKRPSAFTTKAAVGAGDVLYVLEIKAK